MNYAFSLTIKGIQWDAYYFKKDGKPGTLAFCKDKEKDGAFVLGLFCAGTLTREEVEAKLLEN